MGAKNRQRSTKSVDTDYRQPADNRPKYSADTDYRQNGRLSPDTDYYQLIGTPLVPTVSGNLRTSWKSPGI